ncbi:unnamed protein product [Blepharisma stoltei]|uniref:Uncharacterized protein n=1 Tax=Blepharisma stoltei TaxID=1481888 RepID=A0AAU9IRX0_9CILI|nr:unnamed protein product [Blepharisma stoltei]
MNARRALPNTQQFKAPPKQPARGPGPVKQQGKAPAPQQPKVLPPPPPVIIRENFIEKKKKEIAQLKTELSALQDQKTKIPPPASLRVKEYAPQAGSPLASPRTLSLPESSSRPSSRMSRNSKSSIMIAEIGLETFTQLRSIFIRYSSLLHWNQTFFDQSLFRLMCTELNLINSESFTMNTAELLFHRLSQGKQVNFEKFVEIMTEVADIIHKDKENALGILASSLRVPQQRMDQIDLGIPNWKSSLMRSEEMMLIAKYKKALIDCFNIYSNQKCSNPLRIYVHEVIQLGSDLKMIPGLLSNHEAAKIFRLVMNPECLNDSLMYSEFEECIAFIAMFGYAREGIQNTTEALGKMLSYLSSSSTLVKDRKLDGSRFKTKN